MYTLRMLGGTGLTDSEGRDVDALLRRPKHVALLAWLASPKPGTWHRRDSVLAAFWADHEQSKARSALRSALYTLRADLPDGAIKSRGDDEIAIDADFFTTDVARMTDDVASGQFGQALARYEGDLLPGLFVQEAEGFEKWLARERIRVRDIARHAADSLAAEREKVGDLRGAVEAARKSSLLDPDDEGAARRWITLLDRTGDRSQAFAVYDQFRNHLYDTFGVRPSAETVALLDAIRTRHAPAAGNAQLAAAPSPETVASAAEPAAVSESQPVPDQAPARRIRARWIGAALLTALLAWVALDKIAGSANAEPRALVSSSTSRNLIVLPMSNETDDTTLAYVATGIAAGVARRLDGIGGFRVRSLAHVDRPLSMFDSSVLGRRIGPAISLSSTLRRVGDSLEVTTFISDGPASERRRIGARRFTTTGLRNAESMIAADVIGSVFRVPIPTDPRNSAHRVDPESYRLTLEGWHQVFLRPAGEPLNASRENAAALFNKAIDIDPLNARAWSGLSSVWASLVVVDGVSFEEGYPRAVAAAERALALDSLEGTALANLALMRAYEANDAAAATELIRKAQAAEPSNPEVFLVKGMIYRSAHRFEESRDASRISVQLDPLSAYYSTLEGQLEFCAGRPAAALSIYQTEYALNPSNRAAHAGLVRALALVGRYDEAIASWHSLAIAAGDTALASRLARAKGRIGYWTIKRAEGMRKLAEFDREPGRKRPIGLVQASFEAGDSERGYREIEKAEQAGTRALYRLPCMPGADEFRYTPRFKATAARFKLRSSDQKS